MEKKKRSIVEDQLAKVEKKAEERAIEVTHWVMKELKASVEFSNEKNHFAFDAFITIQYSVHNKVTAHFPKLDLSFLDQGNSDDSKDQLQVNPGAIESKVASADIAPTLAVDNAPASVTDDTPTSTINVPPKLRMLGPPRPRVPCYNCKIQSDMC